MRHQSYAKLSFAERNRIAEVLCAVSRLVVHGRGLPGVDDVSEAVGFDAAELLVYLCHKKYLSARGGMSWFNLTERGEEAVAHYCRRAA